jgi:hypothetical protein
LEAAKAEAIEAIGKQEKRLEWLESVPKYTLASVRLEKFFNAKNQLAPRKFLYFVNTMNGRDSSQCLSKQFHDKENDEFLQELGNNLSKNSIE